MEVDIAAVGGAAGDVGKLYIRGLVDAALHGSGGDCSAPEGCGGRECVGDAVACERGWVGAGCHAAILIYSHALIGASREVLYLSQRDGLARAAHGIGDRDARALGEVTAEGRCQVRYVDLVGVCAVGECGPHGVHVRRAHRGVHPCRAVKHQHGIGAGRIA